ncbi:MAG: diol dehydratase reactivase subunit alpha [Defluviitaleaceae bacterium]|nr:diol dehydratase reactivase subunit alpha [Defluviitaleaceae bacterium]
MKILAAVDIGNSTTEVCLAEENDAGKIRFLSSTSVFTTGLKGTADNTTGILAALEEATVQADITLNQISHIRINEAAPVIGGAAMETLTQTIVTESSMLGHNPKTPAGMGTGYGKTILIENLPSIANQESYIVVISSETDYEEAAKIINQHSNIIGAILQLDEAVLVYNRLDKKIPIIDEVRDIHKIKEGIETAIEAAPPGQSVGMLSNPYGIATLLKLTPEETLQITPIAKSLIGAKSAVVMKTPWRNLAPPQKIGSISIKGDKNIDVDFSHGAGTIAKAIEAAGNIRDITGEANTNVGNMLEKARASMTDLAGYGENPQIRDLFAVDTFAPVAISGALAGETSLEKAIAVAAMVTAGRLPMEAIAQGLSKKTGIYTTVTGVEPVMATLGALTTPGAGFPLAILDLGGGSTDAAIIDENGTVKSVSMAGAGELVTLMIQSQLGLASRITAENIKKYPAAKVESMFHIRLENGDTLFYEEGIDPRFFGSVVVLAPGGMIKIEEERPIEKIVRVRQEAKQGVFVNNAIRAIRKLNIQAKHIILVGGSAEDFEIPGFLSTAFADMGMVCGKGNIRGTEGSRNAVATGLIMSYAGGV